VSGTQHPNVKSQSDHEASNGQDQQVDPKHNSQDEEQQEIVGLKAGLLGQALPHVAGKMAESLDRPHAPGQEHQGTAPLPDGQTCYPDS